MLTNVLKTPRGADTAGIANSYRVQQLSQIAFVSGPTVSGQILAPTPGSTPNLNPAACVSVTGIPFAVLSGPVTITVAITGGGPLGTATFTVQFNSGSPVPGTTAAVVDIPSSGIKLNFSNAPNYDTSNVWVWKAGLVDAGLSRSDVFAVGMQPVDISGNQVLFDSCTARVHGTFETETPASPWDGMRVALQDADGTAGPTVGPFISSSANIQHPYHFGVVNVAPVLLIPWQRVEWEWDAVASLWRVVSDSHSGELPPSGYGTVASGTIALLGKCWVQCAPTGAITVDFPTSPTNGMVVRVSDVSGGAGAHNITVNPGAGKTIDNLALGGGAGSTAIVTDNQSATWAYRAAGSTWNLVAINGPHA